MEKTCLNCNIKFEGKVNSKYCSIKCQEDYLNRIRKQVKVSYKIEDYNKILKKAKALKLPIATYVKEVSLSGNVNQKFHNPDYLKIFSQLGKIGNNFNQIAHKLNLLERDNRISRVEVETFKKWLIYHENEFKAINEELINQNK